MQKPSSPTVEEISLESGEDKEARVHRAESRKKRAAQRGNSIYLCSSYSFLNIQNTVITFNVLVY